MRVDYAIRQKFGDEVKQILLPHASEDTARRVFDGLLKAAKAQGYRVVSMSHDCHMAIKPGVRTVHYKFMRVVRAESTEPAAPARLAISRGLRSFGRVSA